MNVRGKRPSLPPKIFRASSRSTTICAGQISRLATTSGHPKTKNGRRRAETLPTNGVRKLGQYRDCALPLRLHRSPFRGERGGSSRSLVSRLFLLNAVQVVDKSENACPHNHFRGLLRSDQLPIGRINIVRQADNRVEPKSPDWHFATAVSGHRLQSVDGFIDGIRWEHPIVFLGQQRQIGRRHLELIADGTFTLSIRAVTVRARRLKLPL